MNGEKGACKTAVPTPARGNSHDIRARACAYALRAVKLYQHRQRQKDGAGWVLGKQYFRATCPIAANVEEGQSGESRADFIHRNQFPKKKRAKASVGFPLSRALGSIP
jgi:hypothetical protein